MQDRCERPECRRAEKALRREERAEREAKRRVERREAKREALERTMEMSEGWPSAVRGLWLRAELRGL